MTVLTSGAKLLRSFLKQNDLTPTAAARALGVSHVTMLAYLNGSKRPDADRRDVIARWTSQQVPSGAWRTARETREIERVEPLPATGTDGGK